VENCDETVIVGNQKDEPLLNGSINFPDFSGCFSLSLDEKFKISEKFIKPFQ
jgi:hypothetical protein